MRLYLRLTQKKESDYFDLQHQLAGILFSRLGSIVRFHSQLEIL